MSFFTPPIFKPTPPASNPVVPAGRLQGIDTSHWNGFGQQDFNTAKAGGAVFCYTKITDGAGSIDYTGSTYLSFMQHAGLIPGGYHFIQAGESPSAQAQNYINHMPKISGMLPPCLDVEVGDYTPWTSTLRAEIQSVMSIWLPAVEQAYNAIPAIYSSPAFLNFLDLPASYSRYVLWLAEYGVQQPKPAKPWGNHYNFWQYSSSARLPGMKSDVDADYFIGTLEQLKELCLA